MSFKQCEDIVVEDEEGTKLWRSLSRQTKLTTHLCSITRDVRNVRGGIQKKIDKLRQLLCGVLSEQTYFEEVCCFFIQNFDFVVIYLKSPTPNFSRNADCLSTYMPTFCVFQPIRSPLAPNVLITGIVPSESSIFKSALHPLRLTFRTENGGSCKIIFKKGDDIRQDQLVFFNLL